MTDLLEWKERNLRKRADALLEVLKEIQRRAERDALTQELVQSELDTIEEELRHVEADE